MRKDDGRLAFASNHERSLNVLLYDPVQPMTKSKTQPDELKGLYFVEEFFLEHKLTRVQHPIISVFGNSSSASDFSIARDS